MTENIIQLRVHCKSCCQELEASIVGNNYINVKPCDKCVKTKMVARPAKREPNLPSFATLQRWKLLRHSPAKMARRKDGDFVKFSQYRKLVAYLEKLERDYENVLSSPCAIFRRCKLCGVMTTDGWVCTHCGKDDSDVRER